MSYFVIKILNHLIKIKKLKIQLQINKEATALRQCRLALLYVTLECFHK